MLYYVRRHAARGQQTGQGGFVTNPHTTRRHVFMAAAFLCAVVLLLCVFRVAVVHGDSMLPTYTNGQMVIVSTLGGSGRLRRGDVILVRVDNDVLIKRVSRLPGETLSAREARSFWRVLEFFEPTRQPGQPYRVPPGYVVVLGDNRAVSDDSRSFGPVPLKSILGRVIAAPASR